MTRNVSRKTVSLTSGRISGHLVRLTLPSLTGAIAITVFNLTDTFFVSRLGTESLAAMGFTFPVVMVVGAVAMGISTGAGSIVARCAGAEDREGVRSAATNGIVLSLAITALIAVLGLSTMDPLFRAMGAGPDTLPLVKQYMRIWYSGCLVFVMPAVGDSNLRATGDMTRPAIVMMTCAVTNAVLDPVFIYGFGPIAPMGISGAALATFIARLFGMAATFVFNRRAGLLSMSEISLFKIRKYWIPILSVGIPTAIIQLLPSLLRGSLTAMASSAVGTVGVAAVAAGSRIESIPMILVWAFNFALLTLMAQNFGAGLHDRVGTIHRILIFVGIVYGMILGVVIWFAAVPLSGIFSDSSSVILRSTQYLRAVFWSSAGMVILTWTSVGLNAIGKPFHALSLNVVTVLGLMIPGAWFGRLLLADDPFLGMMIGLAAAYLLAGGIAWIAGRRYLRPRTTVVI